MTTGQLTYGPLDEVRDYLIAESDVTLNDVIAALVNALDEVRKLRGDVDRLRDRVETLERGNRP